MLRLFPLMALMASYCTSLAQDPEMTEHFIDSLSNMVKTATNDTTLANGYIGLSEVLYMGERERALKYADSAMTLSADRLKTTKSGTKEEIVFKRVMAMGHNNRGFTALRQAKNADALKHFNKALEYQYEINDKRGLSVTYSNIGVVYKDFGDIQKAVDSYLKSLKYAEEIQDSSAIATTVLNLGFVYNNMNERQKGLEFTKRALVIFEQRKDHRGIGVALNNLASNYNYLGDHDKALDYYLRSHELSEGLGYKRGLGTTYGNLGHQYLRMDSLAKALKMYKASLNIYQTLKSDNLLSQAYRDLANCYYKMDDMTKARIYGEQALEKANSTGFPVAIRNSAKSLAKVYVEQKQWDLAYKTREIYTTMRDSIKSEKNEKAMIKSQFKYTYEKEALADSIAFASEQEILVAQSEKQKLGLMGAAGGLVLLLALAFSIYSGKKKSDELLLNILPYETAQELKQKGSAEAKLIDEVTVMFTDFKGFTALAEQLSPKELVEDLNLCFSEFDRIMEKHGIEKIKTIGDAYMAAGGLPTPNTTHAHDVVKAALEMRQFVAEGKARKIASGLPYFEIRIGVHTGPVVAGIVGIKKFAYDIWGDTVNIASRMESSGEVDKVNVSEGTYELIKDEFACEYRGEIEAKGKGKIKMYFLDEKSA